MTGVRRNSKAAVVVLAAGMSLLGAGCSATGEKTPQTTGRTTTSTSEMPALPPEPTPAGAAGISPGGVTTTVDVPADATESQYGQACHAAKLWMDGQGGEPKTLVEPYLKVLQAPEFSDPGNFNTPWTQLTPAQQAGVIMAVNGAANGDCF